MKDLAGIFPFTTLRAFGTRYPHFVAEAYKGDLARAMRSTDKQVARMVLKWLQRRGGPALSVRRVTRILSTAAATDASSHRN